MRILHFSHDVREVLYVYRLSFSPTYFGKLGTRPLRTCPEYSAAPGEARGQERVLGPPLTRSPPRVASDPPWLRPRRVRHRGRPAHAACVTARAPPPRVEAVRMPGAAPRTRSPQPALALDSPAALEPGRGARNPDRSGPSRRGRAAAMVRLESGAVGETEAVSGLGRRVPTACLLGARRETRSGALHPGDRGGRRRPRGRDEPTGEHPADAVAGVVSPRASSLRWSLARPASRCSVPGLLDSVALI